MNATLTIDLPEDIKLTIEKAAREEGISDREYAARAVTDYVFLRRFRSLRERLMAESGKSYTDEEVFELVS